MRIAYPRASQGVLCELPPDFRAVAPDGTIALLDPATLADGPREIAVPICTSTGRRRGTRRYRAEAIIVPNGIARRIVGVRLYPLNP